jgi:hypothetical protein
MKLSKRTHKIESIIHDDTRNFLLWTQNVLNVAIACKERACDDTAMFIQYMRQKGMNVVDPAACIDAYHTNLQRSIRQSEGKYFKTGNGGKKPRGFNMLPGWKYQ